MSQYYLAVSWSVVLPRATPKPTTTGRCIRTIFLCYGDESRLLRATAAAATRAARIRNPKQLHVQLLADLRADLVAIAQKVHCDPNLKTIIYVCCNSVVGRLS